MPSPALLVAVPLIVAALLGALRRLMPRWAADLLAVVTAAGNLAMACWWTAHALHRTQVYWFGGWFPRGRMALGIGFTMDGYGCGLAALAALLTTLALVYSWKHMEGAGGHYHPLMLVFLAAMSGFAVSGDLFNLFVFFELMSTAAFALCGLKTREPAPLAGAFNFAVTNSVAAFLMLTGIALLYSVTGALNLAQIGLALAGRHDRLVIAAFVFLTTGFLVKAAEFPFHFWLPDAHAVSPTPVCVLFSGIMVQLGLFGAMRVYATVFQNCFAGTRIPWLFVVIGAATALWGAMMCFAEHHLKRLLAFSTISHTGLMTMAFGLWTKAALAGLFVYLVAHGLVKAGLFFCAGLLLHRFETMSEPELFGRGRSLHRTGPLWFLGGLGLAAAPGFALWIGETRVTGVAPWTEAIFFIAGAMTGAAVLRVGFRVFAGLGDAGPVDRSARVDEKPETTDPGRRLSPVLYAPAVVCVGGCMALAFWSGMMRVAEEAAASFMDFRGYAHMVYAGSTVVPQATGPHGALAQGMVQAGLRALAAVGVALWAVLHLRIPRAWRWPSHLEGSMGPVRELQSGHPGDYVAWLTVGCAVLGAAAFWLAL
jgi:multicomponent Na+:H+ antiporter subunit D